MRRRRSEFGEVFMNSPAAVRQSECRRRRRRRRRLKVILCGSAHYPILYTHYYSEPKSGVLFGIIPVYYWLVVVIILCAYVHTPRERKSHRAFSCRSTDRAAGAVRDGVLNLLSVRGWILLYDYNRKSCATLMIL